MHVCVCVYAVCLCVNGSKSHRELVLPKQRAPAKELLLQFTGTVKRQDAKELSVPLQPPKVFQIVVDVPWPNKDFER